MSTEVDRLGVIKVHFSFPYVQFLLSLEVVFACNNKGCEMKRRLLNKMPRTVISLTVCSFHYHTTP